MNLNTDNWSKADNVDCQAIKIHEKVGEVLRCDFLVALTGFDSSVIQLILLFPSNGQIIVARVSDVKTSS